MVNRIQSAYQENFLNSFFAIASSVGSFIAILMCVKSKLGIEWLVLSTVGIPIIVNLINAYFLFYRKMPWLIPSVSYFDSKVAKSLLKSGVFFFVLQVTMAVCYSSDSIIIAQVLGANAVAEYAVPFKLFGFPSALLSIALSPLWPAYTEALARGDISWVKKTLKKSLLFAFIFSTFFSICLIFFGKEILFRWVGNSINPSFSLLIGLGVWMIFNSLGNALAMILNAISEMKVLIVSAFATSVSNIVFGIFLAKKMGVAGMIWGTVASFFIFTILPLGFYMPALINRMQARDVNC